MGNTSLIAAEISEIGKQVVVNYMKRKGWKLDKDDVTVVEGRRVLIVVSTKQFKLFDGFQVTGMNSERIQTIQNKGKKLKCSKVCLVFVDAKLRKAYTAYLEVLLQPKVEGKSGNWPKYSQTEQGPITYFSISHFKDMFELSAETVAKLKQLSDQNRNPRQTTLF